MTYQVSDETQAQLDEIHEQGKALGRDGKAFVLMPGEGHDSVIFWDTETEQWLHGNDSTEMGWVIMPRDDFPKGLEIIVSWDEYEAVSVEDTRLWHATYGLDQAREGYGINH